MTRLPIAAMAVALVAGVLRPAPARAVGLAPFATRNQSSLVRIFGLPALGSAEVLAARASTLSLSLGYSSEYLVTGREDEYLLLDGETSRLAVGGRYGVRDGLEVAFEIPWITQTGGFLDGFLRDYHSAFGFPFTGGVDAPRDRSRIQYLPREGRGLELAPASASLGDLQVGAALRLLRAEAAMPVTLALRGALKLPTGNSRQVAGSGSLDVALWLSGATEHALPLGRLGLWGGAGALAMTTGDILPDRQQHVVGFGSLGVGWSPWSWLALKVQADAHSPFFGNSDLVPLASASVELAAGLSFGLWGETVLDLALVEDVLFMSAPDVVFHAALHSSFR